MSELLDAARDVRIACFPDDRSSWTVQEWRLSDAIDAAWVPPETTASPEPLGGPPEALGGQDGPAGRFGAERPGEGRGEPPVIPLSAGLADGGAALLSAVANMMLDFDSCEDSPGSPTGMKMEDRWRQRHRQRLYEALSGGPDLGLNQMSLDGQGGWAVMELLLVLAIGFLALYVVRWLIG